MVTYNDYLSALNQKPLSPIIKIELLDYNENVLDDITSDFVTGNINMLMQNGQRRTATLTLTNKDNKYSPNEFGKIWINNKIRIWTGIVVNGEDYLIQRGVFVIFDCETVSEINDRYINLTLRDKWSILNGELQGILPNVYIVHIGSNIGEALRTALSLSGEIHSPIIVPTDIVSPYTLVINRGETYADLFLKLAGMISYEIFYDQHGILRFQPVNDDNTRPSIWDYSTDNLMYLGSTKKYPFNEVKNVVYVYGNNILGTEAVGIARDEYIFSPTRTSLIGEKAYVITDEIISTNELAVQRAEYELRLKVIIQEKVDLPSINLPHLNEETIVTVRDIHNNLNKDRYLIYSINCPLKWDETATLTLWKVRSLT